MNKNKHILLVMLLSFISIFGYGQKQNLSSKILFRLNSSKVELGYGNNRVQIDALLKICRDTTNKLIRIEIKSYSCPLNGKTYNDKLTRRRSENVGKFMRSRTYMPKGLIMEYNSGIDWDGLRVLVEESDMQYERAVLDIIDNVPEETWVQNRYKTLVDSRNKQLMDLKWGRPYRYMMKHLFPQLRNSSIITMYYRKLEPIAPSLMHVEQKFGEEHITISTMDLVEQVPVIAKTPLFAIKTNLLFDIVLAPNIEIEIPFGTKWSIHGEFTRSWWLRKDNTFCWQIQIFGVEGRYWFGSKKRYRPLTGWFMGVFSNAGFYDLQLKKDTGSQGKFIISGISGGYCFPINENLSLELSAGIGYVINDYTNYMVRIVNTITASSEMRRYYELIKQGSERRFQSILPAKAKISFVWMFNRTKKKGVIT